MKRWILPLYFISMTANATCFQEVEQKYNINQLLLKSIAYTESRFNGDAVNCANSDQSCDYGFAQINIDEWRDELNEFGISLQDLNDPCQNLHFGAWVLAKNFESHGRNWNSVGAYNAGFAKNKAKAREVYIALIQKNLAMIRKLEQQ